jgi:hypothetical protein
MESLINEKILSFLESDNINFFSDHQYGFRKQRSTGDLLSYISHSWSSAIDKGGIAAVISLDISKAFDRVWHPCLINKLHHAGIHSSIIAWIKNYLFKRSLSVRIDGIKSKEHQINAGVPQGCVLAPTLFLIYINDLLKLTDCDIHSYADDSTTHTTVLPARNNSINPVPAADSLSNDLSKIIQWGKANLVEFNSSKTHELLISNRQDVDEFPSIYMSDTVVAKESSLSMLGLTIDNKLSYKKHITSIATSAARKLGFLFRAKSYFTPAQRLTLYKSQVRPVLEYCSHIFAGAPDNSLKILDGIQRKAIRLIDDPALTSNLQSLGHRRAVGSLSLFYRYYFGLCSSELQEIIPRPIIYRKTTRKATNLNPYLVSIDRCRTSSHATSFIPRTAVLWNKLPLDVFPLSRNLQQFKSRINRLELTSL